MKTRFILASLVAATSMLISCNKENPIPTPTPEVDEAQKAMPMTRAYGDKTPKIAVYVETNDVNPLNAGDYFIGDEPFVDIVELFAANIHKETVNGQVRPTLYLNDKLAPVLETYAGESMADIYIRPLQDLGIKVLLTVLGDWQGIGVANMTDTQAEQFATILAHVVEEYGLDGIGFDDEYANYSGSLVSGSFGNIITKLHALLPADKLITVFAYGNTSQINSTAGALIDYAYTDFTYWNSSPDISGVTNAKWAPSAYNLGGTLITSLVQSYAQNAKNSGYGAIMNFNLRPRSDRDPLSHFQAISNGCGWGTVTCVDGDQERDAGSDADGYTIKYSEAAAE